MTKKGISESFYLIKETIKNLSKIEIPITKIICEPQLSKRKLYPTLSKISKFNKNSSETRNILNFLQYSDKSNSIEQISLNVYNILKKYKLVHR